jgi:hypothetical protein
MHRPPLDKEAEMSGTSDNKSDRRDPELQNEGEGSRTAARRYDEAATRTASDAKHVKEAADKAKDALDGPEGEELRAAEERGKKHQPGQGDQRAPDGHRGSDGHQHGSGHHRH